MDKAIEELSETGLELEDQGDIKDYLGINFQYSDDGKIIMSQPQLIDSIIRDLQIKNPNVPEIPALSTQILGRNENSSPFDENFHYRSVVATFRCSLFKFSHFFDSTLELYICLISLSEL